MEAEVQARHWQLVVLGLVEAGLPMLGWVGGPEELLWQLLRQAWCRMMAWQPLVVVGSLPA
jgi:hypothetical protein